MSEMTSPPILVVDDEPGVHGFLGPVLEAAGYRPLRADTAEGALTVAAAQRPAAILLDLGLPDLDGLHVLEQLRKFFNGPILVVSARDREQEKVMALDAGADDYVEKPFGVTELLARLRASLRRVPEEEPPSRFQVGPLSIDAEARVALLSGQPLELPPQLWKLLLLLARNAERTVPHDLLFASVWGARRPNLRHTLRVQIHNLRRVLANSGIEVQGEHGYGYRLTITQGSAQSSPGTTSGL